MKTSHSPVSTSSLEGLFGVRIASLPDSEIGRLGPGEIIGEISFLENTLPSATVTAIESSLLLEIPIVLLAERLKADSVIRSTVLPGARHSQFPACERACQFIDGVVPGEIGRNKLERRSVASSLRGNRGVQIVPPRS